jgi:hypothetical protein
MHDVDIDNSFSSMVHCQNVCFSQPSYVCVTSSSRNGSNEVSLLADVLRVSSPIHLSAPIKWSQTLQNDKVPERVEPYSVLGQWVCGDIDLPDLDHPLRMDGSLTASMPPTQGCLSSPLMSMEVPVAVRRASGGTMVSTMTCNMLS